MRKLIVVAIMFLTLTSAMAAGKPQTFTGEVSDSMCGAKHMMEGNAACTRACVRKGFTGVADGETIEVSKVAAAQ